VAARPSEAVVLDIGEDDVEVDNGTRWGVLSGVVICVPGFRPDMAPLRVAGGAGTEVGGDVPRCRRTWQIVVAALCLIFGVGSHLTRR
jgi:hypothetical protein